MLLILVTVLGYFTYMHNYQYPAAFFWDENYHITSAQKYMHHVFFQQGHPPLGKLLIAAGEVLLKPNEKTDQFLSTTYAKGEDLPEGFSFAGYRFFPALLAWLAAPLFFVIFLLITRRALLATFLSFLYIFDNALIVHNRGLMLEAPLIFFIILTILAFFLILEWKDTRHRFAFACTLFGAAFAAAFTTKMTGLILVLMVPMLFFALKPQWKKFLHFAVISFAGFSVVFCGVWWLHFSLARTVNPELLNNGYFHVSEEYHATIDTGKTSSPLAFPIMLADSFRFVFIDNSGVPRLDLCKPDENGSPFFLWPFGARTINYRWSTPDSELYGYLYLVSNPLSWFIALAGILFASALVICPSFFPFKTKIQNRFLLATFLLLYLCYMAAMSQISRVMYLYHYFPALIFSFVLTALAFMEMQRFGPLNFKKETHRTAVALVCAVGIFFSYQFYRPFSYEQPISDGQFAIRNIFPLWEMRCVRCEKQSMLVIPRSCPQ
jgi:dolichyl-phosphate-mannose--protein O-mannosyl transferase